MDRLIDSFFPVSGLRNTFVKFIVFYGIIALITNVAVSFGKLKVPKGWRRGDSEHVINIFLYN